MINITGKPTTQSSTFIDASPQTYGSEKAVDGIYLPSELSIYETASLAYTLQSRNPWWRVDLEQSHCISAVNILNRAGKYFNK